MITWDELCDSATKAVASASSLHQNRLKFELTEIVKQGAEAKWVGWHHDIKNKGKKFPANPHKLILPWALGLWPDDPLDNRKPEDILCTVRASKIAEFKKQYGYIPSDIIKDPDMPDIDIDCLPDARDPLKQYAIERYGTDCEDGYGSVCSVGTWQAYKFKSAIIDVSTALGLMDRYAAERYTTNLPEDVDGLAEGGVAACKGQTINEKGEKKECGFKHADIQCPKCGSADTDGPTLAKLLVEYPPLQELRDKYGDVIVHAANLIGKVRNMGMHAGALIITDRPLYGNVPLAKSGKKGFWISMWTEGRNTQLSKLGYVKWDWLGLKTLQYIHTCCQLIEENRGISFGENMCGWDDIDPTQDRVGYFVDPNGVRHNIPMNDPETIRTADDIKVDSIFQFDTPLAQQILGNGVKAFNDLLFYNAAGHPGPMASIPEAVKNRDDKTGAWRDRLREIHPVLAEILGETYGIILYQEQLAAIWQALAGFTSPEAQEARKAVAKKHTHKLKDIGKKWMEGATPKIGHDNATALWDSMVSFGRYAFNKSHAISYVLVAYRCLWLKTHFAPEWWASVMSGCHPDKLIRYMGTARSESWKPTETTKKGRIVDEEDYGTVRFRTLDVNNLTISFTASDNSVNQGLTGVKGFGGKAAQLFQGKGDFTNVDQFVAGDKRRNKTFLERFIKLGAFAKFEGHGNMKALWMYYQYTYCTGVTALKKEIKALLMAKSGWTEKAINEERARQTRIYLETYPKRNKIPPKIAKWMPDIDDSRESIMSLYEDDFTMPEKLGFQKQYLGYYIDSPLDVYRCRGGCSISDARINGREGDLTRMEAIVIDFELAKSKNNNKEFGRLKVTDGVQETLILIWNNELPYQDAEALQPNVGIIAYVNYDVQRNSFTMGRRQGVARLAYR